jgi:hypothetical protein
MAPNQRDGAAKTKASNAASRGAKDGEIRHEGKENHEAQTRAGTGGPNGKTKIPHQVTKAKTASKSAQQKVRPDLLHPRRKTCTTLDKMQRTHFSIEIQQDYTEFTEVTALPPSFDYWNEN